MGWLRIRSTQVSVLDVLEALAKGEAIRDILARFPCLTENDIACCADIARSIIVGHWALCDSPARVLPRGRQGANARRQSLAWTPDEDAELIRLNESGATINDITRLLMRLKTDVASRLERIDKSKR